MTAAAVSPLTGWTLGIALDRFIDEVRCRETTRLNHEKYSRALVRFFKERPITDFAGKSGGALVMTYVRFETGDGDRGLRETFGGEGALSRALTYDSLRQRLRTLRLALNHAVRLGELNSLPEPWPIPQQGSHGHLVRGALLVPPSRTYRPEPKKKRSPLTTRAAGAVREAPAGAVTLATAIDWFMLYGTKRLAAPTVDGHRWQASAILRFFGNRPLADFEGPAGYCLLWEYAEAEGPTGRGAKFCSLKKRLTTLRLVLKEANRRGAVGALPSWPELPDDTAPRERYLTYEEYARVRRALPDRPRLWLDLAIWTGMHTSDVNGTTWAMVDLGSGPGLRPGSGAAFWFRRNTKNGTRPLWLQMPDELRAYLTAEWQARERPPLPSEPIAGAFDNRNLSKALRRGAWRVGVPRFAPIDCRRTCATWWIEKGGPKDALKLWLGHTYTSGMVDKHYAQVTPALLDGGISALNRAGSVRHAPIYLDHRSLGPMVPSPTEVV